MIKKTLLTPIKHLPFWIVFLACSGVGFLTHIMSTYAVFYYGITSGGGVQIINEHQDCKKVINTGENDIFVPTRSAGEWQAFRNHAPSNSGGKVILEGCAPSGCGAQTITDGTGSCTLAATSHGENANCAYGQTNGTCNDFLGLAVGCDITGKQYYYGRITDISGLVTVTDHGTAAGARQVCEDECHIETTLSRFCSDGGWRPYCGANQSPAVNQCVCTLGEKSDGTCVDYCEYSSNGQYTQNPATDQCVCHFGVGSDGSCVLPSIDISGLDIFGDSCPWCVSQ